MHPTSAPVAVAPSDKIMSLKSTHPQYDIYKESWQECRDFEAGADVVKKQGIKYLPPTEGMLLDGMKEKDLGLQRYLAYVQRARVPDYVTAAVEVIVGLLHQKPPVIELPGQLEYLRERASSKNETLTQLYRRVTVEQVTTGRVGLLGDTITAGVQVGQLQLGIALYSAESILNWDDGDDEDDADAGKLCLVVLDESGYARTGMDWNEVERYRVLALGDGDTIGEDYHFHQFTSANGLMFASSDMQRALYQGAPLKEIPFVFVNSTDLLAEPQRPPLKGLVEMCKGIYQSEADYRQNLYMQGQDTLVVIGGVRNPEGVPGQDADAIRTGSGSRIEIESGGDAKYVGVSSLGLQEQRIAIENDRKRSQIKAGELIQSAGSQMESGNALSTRFNAQTATLNQLAATAAGGLERLLKILARWVGANDAEVKVTPNTEFIDFQLDGQNFNLLMDAKGKGLPISYETLHELMVDRGLASVDFQTEVKRIEAEKAIEESLKPTPETTPAPGNNTPPSNTTPANE